MMQQRERLYQLDRPILARDTAGAEAEHGLAIPPGWIGLEQCNLSPVQGQALRMPHVLLNPEVGVALIDVAPGETAGAEPAFRARLEAARFAAIFPGQLPVVHLQLQPEELHSLGSLLPQAFATLPPLSLPGGDGWVSVVRRALASRGPLRDGAAEPVRDRAMPQMLNREVAAQRAGLASPSAVEDGPPNAQRARWPGLPIALGLAGLTAVAAAAVVSWTGSQPAPPAVATAPAPAPERSGTSAPPPPTVAKGGAAPVVAPALVPPAPPAPARRPEPPPPAARDRAAAQPPPPEPVPERASPPPAVAAAIPPPAAPAAAAPAADRTPRLTVRAAANIRSSPNNKASIIRTAPQGEVLREFNRSFDDWVEVGDTKPQGWMFGKYLVPVKP